MSRAVIVCSSHLLSLTRPFLKERSRNPDNVTSRQPRLEPIVPHIRRTEMERIRFSRAVRIVSHSRRVHPPLLIDRMSLRPNIFLVISFRARELPSGESSSNSGLAAFCWRSLRDHFGDCPVDFVARAAW